MAKYMLIMRTTEEALKATEGVPFAEILDAMGKFNDELIRAGVLLATEGFADPDEGVVVDFTGEEPDVIHGPYGGTREMFGGFYILDVPSMKEAVEWARRAPYMKGNRIEIRRIPSIDEFPQDNQWIQKERAWRERTGQL